MQRGHFPAKRGLKTEEASRVRHPRQTPRRDLFHFLDSSHHWACKASTFTRGVPSRRSVPHNEPRYPMIASTEGMFMLCLDAKKQWICPTPPTRNWEANSGRCAGKNEGHVSVVEDFDHENKRSAGTTKSSSFKYSHLRWQPLFNNPSSCMGACISPAVTQLPPGSSQIHVTERQAT